MDLDALTTTLDIDPNYDADVRGGHNGKLVTLLNAEDGALPKRWRPIPVIDFVDAISGETLSAEQHDWIQTYLAAGGGYPIHKAGVRGWVMAQGFSAVTVTALTNLSQVPGKPADAFFGDEGGRVSLNDVRAAVAQISKSFISQPR